MEKPAKSHAQLAQERAGAPLAVTHDSGYGAFVNLVVAGQALYAALDAERDARVPQDRGLYESEALCQLQKEQSRRGIVGAKLTPSLYGWSLRYDSGLQDFAIIAGSRRGDLDGTYADCLRFAQQWVEADPTRRYAWVSESGLRDYDQITGQRVGGSN